MPTTTPGPAATGLPDVPPDAVRALYAEVAKAAARFNVSSGEIVLILDDWFVAQGYPTVI